MKKLLVMGSSGSIGESTLEVVRLHRDQFSIEGLAVNSNTDVLMKQAIEFEPKYVAIRDEKKAEELVKALPSTIRVFKGRQGLTQIAQECGYDIFVGAMVGFAGLPPTLEAIKRGKRIALANKETLVAAGELVTELCRQHQAELLPIDSEHSAIFQCLAGEQIEEVAKIILTASGGPFYTMSKSDFEHVTVEQALNHPTWKMGAKITVDSATMMNKGLEVIEARWLFDVPKEKIDVVIHPQSIIHSMVAFTDGSIKAQLSVPDMKIPIQYALSYPRRFKADYVHTSLPAIGTMTFFEPDHTRFECLKLAYDALQAGGTTPCILNASNEVAVARFLRGDIGFTGIPYILNKTLDRIAAVGHPRFEDIIECDRHARQTAEAIDF
jgi:1-deoxy-D-xylulose-5-phosphate reductoisomerase